MDYDERLRQLGIELPDFGRDGYYGSSIGSMKSHHRVGNLLFLSGHIPMRPDGTLLHPGVLGKNLTVEQGYEAARLTGINVLAGIKYALGDLNRVAGIVRSLNFVVCTPEFFDVPKVSNGATDLFVEVFGEAAGLGGRATIGVVSLHGGACFENWVTLEARD